MNKNFIDCLMPFHKQNLRVLSIGLKPNDKKLEIMGS